MKPIAFFFLLLIIIGSIKTTAQTTIIGFDKDWRFHLGGAMGAEDSSFNDGEWRKIELPHDWSIEDIAGTHSPFNKNAVTQLGGGFTQNGTGWYRKIFRVDAGATGKQIFIQFDGVYMNADVWLNGHHLGNHPYGYTGFYYDITRWIKLTGVNTLAVEVKNEGANSRWYAGSGIYRHVWLNTVAPLHVGQWGVFVTTPEITNDHAKVNVNTEIINETKEDASVHIITKLIDASGVEAAKIESDVQLVAAKKQTLTQQGSIQNPQRWSCETPVLYKAVTEIYKDGKLLDNETTAFGIRTISFDTSNGFRLNGKTVKLKGGCVHSDNGPLGAKAYDRAEERKIELLKASGYNAVRCAHNPPSPAFLETCDRLGMLVIDEAFDMWNYSKTPFDYHLYFKDWWQKDMESMIIRDRNHPSIILWSIGNELPERASAEGVGTAKLLVQFVKNLDTTRPTTSAVNGLRPDKDPFFATLDVAGYNYSVVDYSRASTYENDHKRVPARIMVGTESYPLEAFGNWMEVEDHTFVIGDFVWTSFDYIGEASIGWLGYPQTTNFFPWNLAFCGDIDICGWKRPQSFYRDVLWKKNQLSVFVKPPAPSFKENPSIAPYSRWNWFDVVPEWNWQGNENTLMDVVVYSSCEETELFLNGKSLGIQPTNRSTKFMATWKVPYTAGELKASGYNSNGHTPVANTVLYTAAKPAKIELIADRIHLKAGNQDLSYITVLLEDEKGNVNPTATNPVNFTVNGDATIAGTGNANPRSTESYQLSKRNAWKGRCMLIVKAGDTKGVITITVKSPGLLPAEIKLTTQ